MLEQLKNSKHFAEFVEWMRSEYWYNDDYPNGIGSIWHKEDDEPIRDRELTSLIKEWLRSKGVWVVTDVCLCANTYEEWQSYEYEVKKYGLPLTGKGAYSDWDEATEAGIKHAFELLEEKK